MTFRLKIPASWTTYRLRSQRNVDQTGPRFGIEALGLSVEDLRAERHTLHNLTELHNLTLQRSLFKNKT